MNGPSKTFLECWLHIRQILPGTTLEARSRKGGAFGQFQVTATSDTSIRVQSGAVGSRRIPRTEFEGVFVRLQMRTNGVPDLLSTSSHSEYILGILHHVGAFTGRQVSRP